MVAGPPSTIAARPAMIPSMIAEDPLHAEGADAAGEIPGGVRHPPWLLAAGGAVALAALIVTLIGLFVDRGHRFAFDSAILLAARHGEAHGVPVGPYWMKQAAIDVTALGGETVLVLVVLITAGFLAVRRLWLTLALVLGGTISGSIAVAIVKSLVGRPRPDLTDHLVQVSSESFPSGHAANSAIIYLTIATLIMQIAPGRIAPLYPDRRGAAGHRDRHEPGLSRRALAKRRAWRLGVRNIMGDRLVGDRRLGQAQARRRVGITPRRVAAAPI